MEKTPERFGPGAVFANDSGSENMPEAEERLASRGVTQYWARPKKPKDKPFVERLIGTLQRECLDYSYEPMCAGELHKVADARLDKCRHYRPRESLGFLTPAEHSAMLSVPVPKRAGAQEAVSTYTRKPQRPSGKRAFLRRVDSGRIVGVK